MPDSHPSAVASARRFLFASIALAVLAALLFTPGLPGGFVFDDHPNIVNNPTIRLAELDMSSVMDILATPQVSGPTRGLPMLTFALDYWRAGGADPGAFKTTNIVIHALTAFALAWFFRTLLRVGGIAQRRAMWLALAMTLAWAVHPLQVSSVLYAVQRLQTMGTLFLVLALLAYLKGREAQILGRSGRSRLLLALLLWGAALACKEDSILLPVYALAIELTVLRFAATVPATTQALRQGYRLAALAGAAVYLLWIVPHYWQWDAYPGRDFSSMERLLTQGRVLCLYLWQILLPLPQHMPFYYDWLQPSRGVLQPWTTLPAFAVVLGLLFLAWMSRIRRPLFSLGVFLYFAAHFISSNVIGLELAYEHRNHFALIGVVLAVVSLVANSTAWMKLRPVIQIGLCVAILFALGIGTVLRAHAWRSNVTLAQASTAAAPGSPRAWIELCDALIKAGGPVVRTHPHLDEAIDACTAGAASNPDSLNSLALLVVLKTVREDVTGQDWRQFHERLERATMSWDNMRAPLIFGHYAGLGVGVDKSEVLAALATLDRRAALRPNTLVTIGYSIMDDLDEPDLAVPYFVRALEAVSPGDPFANELSEELRGKGRPELAEIVERAGRGPRPPALISAPDQVP